MVKAPLVKGSVGQLVMVVVKITAPPPAIWPTWSLIHQIGVFIKRVREVVLRSETGQHTQVSGSAPSPPQRPKPFKHGVSTFCCVQIRKLLSICFSFLLLPSGPLTPPPPILYTAPQNTVFQNQQLRGLNTRRSHARDGPEPSRSEGRKAGAIKEGIRREG